MLARRALLVFPQLAGDETVSERRMLQVRRSCNPLRCVPYRFGRFRWIQFSLVSLSFGESTSTEKNEAINERSSVWFIAPKGIWIAAAQAN